MARYNDIREAIAQSIKDAQLGLAAWAYVPKTFNAPAAIVKPSIHGTIDYLQTQANGFAEWHFTVEVILGVVNEAAAQTRAGELIEPGSGLIRAINKTRIPNSRTQWVKALSASVGEQQVPAIPGGAGLYTCVWINVQVKA